MQVAPLLRFLLGTLCEGSPQRLQRALAAGAVPPEVSEIRGVQCQKDERERERGARLRVEFAAGGKLASSPVRGGGRERGQTRAGLGSLEPCLGAWHFFKKNIF